MCKAGAHDVHPRGREDVRKGQRHKQSSREAISRAQRERWKRTVEDDALALKLIGQCEKWEFAERMECSIEVAERRLKKLIEGGYAERFRVKGRSGFVYVATLSAGDGLRGATRRRRRELT